MYAGAPHHLRRTCRRRLLALALLLAVAGPWAAWTAAPASAHASLVRITPSNGQTLTSPPTVVTLVFDDVVATSFATVTVTDPAGRVVSSTRPTVSGSTLSNKVTGRALVSGRYRIAWRVVSDDGHPVSGQSSFTLAMGRTPGAGTATATSAPSSVAVGSATPLAAAAHRPAATSQPSSWLARNPVALVGAVVLVLAAAALAWGRRRP